ncbi:MAG: hypothetical protein ACI9VT_004043, partial [Psychroserpens sp.]
TELTCSFEPKSGRSSHFVFNDSKCSIADLSNGDSQRQKK